MPRKIDLTNQHFGEWTVIREASKEEKQSRPGAYWLCKCSCGTEKIVNGQTLRKGESRSCGCKTGDIIAHKNNERAENLSGRVFGRLTVIQRDYDKEKSMVTRGSTYWKCKCNCGNETTVSRNSLLNGTTISCGCYRKEKSAQHLAYLASNNYIDETGNRYGKLVVLKKANKISNYGTYWVCQCNCGNVKIILGSSLRTGNTTSCGCIGNSKGEYLIKNILENNNILYIKEYPIKIDNKILRYDFAILDNNNNIQYLIEYDDKQHFEATSFFGGNSQLLTTQINDNIKNQWCKTNNIPLIRIPYTHLHNLCIEDLILETSKFIIYRKDN